MAPRKFYKRRNKSHKDWRKHAYQAFGEARPLLADWGKELQRDEFIEAITATIPTPLVKFMIRI